MYASTSLKVRQRGFLLSILLLSHIKNFHCDKFNVADNSISTFEWYFVYVQQIWIRIF